MQFYYHCNASPSLQDDTLRSYCADHSSSSSFNKCLLLLPRCTLHADIESCSLTGGGIICGLQSTAEEEEEEHDPGMSLSIYTVVHAK